MLFRSPDGGPFISVDSDYGFGKITEIIVEKTTEGNFKIRVEVDQ